MIPQYSQPLQQEPLCITTAAMDGSVNDRATKRQRGVRGDDPDKVSNSSNHTVSTSSSTYSGDSSTVTTTTSVTNNKRVSFAPITAIHTSDWTRDEVDAGWYSKDELADLKQERKSLVKVLKRVQFDLSRVDTSVHCLRGYEAYFSIQANKEYKFKRQMVWKAVLQEQQRQRHQNRTDAMMMQLVSSHATQWARDTATELGMQDAQVALSIFLEYMREQQEDDLFEEEEECEEFDEQDFDDDPIAVNWNEPQEQDYFCEDNGLELFSHHQQQQNQYNDWNMPQQLTLDNAAGCYSNHNHNQQQS